MSTRVIVSYDGTPNDDDGLALGRLLARSGASISLAYVRHSVEFDPAREALAAHDAERRLDLGATGLGLDGVGRHVIVSPSTGAGLAELARSEEAGLIVFGSDYRTTPGRVEPGSSARFLLEGGRIAVAIAPSGLRARRDEVFGQVAVVSEGDPVAESTASALASALGVGIAGGPTAGGVGLVVLASAPGTPDGVVRMSGFSRNLVENLRAALLVLPRSTALEL